jgi:hypothetical protein
MTPEEINNVQFFLSTTAFTKKHKKIFDDVLYIDIPAEELAEILQNQNEEFKKNLQESAGITTSKIAHRLFFNLEFDIEEIDNLLKSDSPSLPDSWKDSFNRQNVSFTIKRPLAKLMRGEIELENLNEEEKLSTCIKILRANAEFVLHGIPELQKQHIEKKEQLKKQLEEEQKLQEEKKLEEEQNLLEKIKPKISISKSDEKAIYKLWSAGILQCDIDR